MIEELFVPSSLDHRELMWVPELTEDRLNIVLVHAKMFDVLLRATSTDKRAECNIGVCRLLLLTVNTISIELIISYQLCQFSPLFLGLLLLYFGIEPCVMHRFLQKNSHWLIMNCGSFEAIFRIDAIICHFCSVHVCLIFRGLLDFGFWVCLRFGLDFWLYGHVY